MKVLYATDGLPPALAAGRLLERIADPHRVGISALSVFETVVRSTPDYPDIVLEQIARRARWASETADDGAQILLRGDYKAEAITAEGDPGEEIVLTVGRGGFDLTVMGACRKSHARQCQPPGPSLFPNLGVHRT
jgi:nucleotide-binding universal stress UspA family protein